MTERAFEQIIHPAHLEYLRDLKFHPPKWVMDTEGFISEGEMWLLTGLASSVPAPLLIVELGTYRGKSTLALAYGSDMGAKVAIVTFDHHAPFTEPTGESYGPQDLPAMYRNFARAPDIIGQLIRPCTMAHRIIAPLVKPRTVGMLFVDDEHTPEAVYAATTAWAPALTDRAIVVYHDYNYAEIQDGIQTVREQGGVLLNVVSAVGSMGIFQYTIPTTKENA